MTLSSTATPRSRPDLRAAIAERLGALGLELHPEKTKIVYCKDTNRRGSREHTSFDFLGYTFRARLAKGRVGILRELPAGHERHGEEGEGSARSGPGTSTVAAGRTCPASPRRSIPRCEAGSTTTEPSTAPSCTSIAARIDEHLVRWAMQKFKRLRGRPDRAWALAGCGSAATADALRPLASPHLTDTPDCGSRMTGDCHVRF